MPEPGRREQEPTPRRRRASRSPSPPSSSRSYSPSFSSSFRSLSSGSYSPSPPRRRRRIRDEPHRRSRYQHDSRDSRRSSRYDDDDSDEDDFDRYQRRPRSSRNHERGPLLDDGYERRARDRGSIERWREQDYERRPTDERDRTRRFDGDCRHPRRDDAYVRRKSPVRERRYEARRLHDNDDGRRFARRRGDEGRISRIYDDDRDDHRNYVSRRSPRRSRSRSRSRSPSRSFPPQRERGYSSYRDDHHGHNNGTHRQRSGKLPPRSHDEPRMHAQRPSGGVSNVRDPPGAVERRRDWLLEDERAAAAGETMWQRRQRMRDRATERMQIWDVSPEPPKRLEDRFEVGADERKKKERKRKRKEERRLKKEAKRAKMSAANVIEDKAVEDGRIEDSRPDKVASQAAEEVRRQERGPHPAPADEGGDDDDDDGVIGPPLPALEKDVGGKNVDYGKALRPGEGSKMAAFVQDGERIPRRGEIGLTSEQIEAFEAQGFVMSGSRNQRMEAVRIRKENQIYSAEELAALSQFSHEERKLREERVLNQFRVLVESKLGDGSAGKPPLAPKSSEDGTAQELPLAPVSQGFGK